MRVAERVALPTTDQRHGRSPHRERFGNGAVRASVMRHLHHVHLLRERLERPALRALLGVAEQQRALAPSLEQEDHARVVGFEPALASGRPQHAHGRVAHRPGHVPPEAEHLAGPAGASGRQPVDGGVVHVRHTDPGGPRHASETGQSSDVVRVGVREHDPVKRAYLGARERTAQHHGIRPRVDEQRVRAIAHEDGVTLTDVEHDDARPRWKRRQHDRAQQDRDRDARRPHTGSPARSRPSGP